MYIIKKYLLIFSLFFYGFNTYGQDMRIFPRIIGLNIMGLNQFDLPEVYSNIWNELSRSYNRQYYIDEYGHITIKKEENIYYHMLEYDGGTFTGNYGGEWGGELFFQNNTNRYKILSENICEIINFNNEIYVLTGLSHLSISKGRIIKLELKNGKWENTVYWELDSCPETYKIYNNKLYIVTFYGLILFDGNNVQQIFNKQFWSGLYPKTIFVNEKLIAIGMRGCVAIINKENNEIKCYK